MVAQHRSQFIMSTKTLIFVAAAALVGSLVGVAAKVYVANNTAA